MSSIITFFPAGSDDAAVDIAQAGVEPPDSVTYGNFEVWSAIEEWHALLVTDGEAVPLDLDGPDTEDVDVTAVPPDLTRALAAADDAHLAATASAWLAMRETEGESIDPELGGEILGEVARLATTAEDTGRTLYCWVY